MGLTTEDTENTEGEMAGTVRASFSSVGFRESWTIHGRPSHRCKYASTRGRFGRVSACLHGGGRVKVYKRKTLHSASVVFGMIRICAEVQAWLGFAGVFLNQKLYRKIVVVFLTKKDPPNYACKQRRGGFDNFTGESKFRLDKLPSAHRASLAVELLPCFFRHRHGF
jgi:hypothetical protein